MPSPQRRRSTPPTPDDLAGLDDTRVPDDRPAAGGLAKAAPQNPVLRPQGADPTAEPPPAGTRPSPSARAAGPYGAAGGSKRPKVGFYQDAEDTARARAAYRNTSLQEGHRSFSDFVAAALMAEVERLERTYNSGSPWPGLEAGEIPTGKPFGN